MGMGMGMGMGKLMIVLLGLCVCVFASDEYVPTFEVVGSVYCDKCRAGFENEATPGIAGAKVKIECKKRDADMVGEDIAEGVCDSEGKYTIFVKGDRGDQICDVKLVWSPLPDCNEFDQGRSSSRIILTNSNGLASEKRYANSLGCLRKEAMAGCTKLLKKYSVTDDEY